MDFNISTFLHYFISKCIIKFFLHSKTETVSKFFRVGSTSQQIDSPTHSSQQQDEEQQDNISVISMSSLLSTNSQNSSALGTFDVVNKTDDSIPEIEILNEHEIAAIKRESNAQQLKSDELQQDTTTIPILTLSDRDIFIGSIRDQPLIYYTARLIASKFLLFGIPNQLIEDTCIRISIKNSSLTVISYCVELCPNVLLLSLQKNDEYNENELQDEQISDSDEDSSASNSNKVSSPVAKQSTNNNDAGEQLNMKDDHFGENSKIPSTYFDFFFPLSKSADNVLLSRLNSDSDRSKQTEKLSGDLSDLLSKSDIVESKSAIKCRNNTANSNTDLKPLENTLSRLSLDQSIDLSKSQQWLEDILFFWNHSDPVLRANIQLLIGNFISNVLQKRDSVECFIATSGIANNSRFLNFNILLHILMKVFNKNQFSIATYLK